MRERAGVTLRLKPKAPASKQQKPDSIPASVVVKEEPKPEAEPVKDADNIR